jgi:hypothetical protein
MPLVLSKTVAATAVSAAVATTTPQQVCYYVPTNHVFWDRIETVVDVVCVVVPQPLNETKWSER